ncbi:hypothetical protein SRHO_G00290200 [Serrasalmus rhombeus]
MLPQHPHIWREHLRVAQQRQKNVYDLKAQEKVFNVGDLVYLRDTTKQRGQSPKLQAPWKGPCVVSACYGPVLCEVQGMRHRKVMHHDRLKPYNSEVTPAWIRRWRNQALQCSTVSTNTGTQLDLPHGTDQQPASSYPDMISDYPEAKQQTQPETQGQKHGAEGLKDGQTSGQEKTVQAAQEDSNAMKMGPKTVKTLRGQEVHKPYNYEEHDPRNTGDDRSNASNSEDEINKLGNEDFEKDVEEINNEDDQPNTEDDMSNASNSEDDDDEVNSEISSTTSLLGTDIQESDNEDDKTNTEDSMSNASNSADEEDEMDNENSCTISLFGADIQEVSEDRADTGDTPLYPGAPLSKGESVLMLMSYLLRPSPLMKLSHFQMINGLIPEYQHNVFLGVTRQLSTLWFDTGNSEAPWYFGKQIE